MGRPRKNPDDPKWTQQPVMLVANETFSVSRDGADRMFHKDQTRIMSNHPWVKGIEHLFVPITAHYPTVEAATAAPGEVRGG